ncbi:SCO family protein [Xanthobacteraceae bacterium A53D]
MPALSSRTKIIALFCTFAAGALLLVVAITSLLPERQAVSTPATVGGPFQMVDQDGQPVTEAATKGRPTLVFFGFTHCPDVCPTALFEISEMFAALGPDADKARAIFITVDPERDTPEVMKSYISSFVPQLRGYTGSVEQVEAVKKGFRVFARKVPLSDGGYTMDHTAVVYLMDKDGNFVAPFNIKRPPAEAAAELKRYL